MGLELKLANIKKSIEKYPDPDEENKAKTTEELNKEKNEKLIELMDDQEMRDSLYNLFPTPFEIKERKEQENMSIHEIEEEEEEEYDVQRDVELMKKLLDQGDRIPFSIELTPCKIPTNEFNSAIKVIDESQDADALKSSFLTIRKVAVFHTDLIKSSPFILSNLIARIKRYIASDANIMLSLHSLKAYDGKNILKNYLEMVQHMPGVLKKYSEDFLDLLNLKYFTLEDRILCIDKEIDLSEEGNLSITESNLQSHNESMMNENKNNSKSFQNKTEKDEIIIKSKSERAQLFIMQKEILSTLFSMCENIYANKVCLAIIY